MTNDNFCYLNVTCTDTAEASKIAKHLLQKKLVVCAKQINLDRVDYWWQGKIVDGQETMLIMESREDLFDAVEAELKKIHSYETFVLEMIPIIRVNSKAADWMRENLQT